MSTRSSIPPCARDGDGAARLTCPRPLGTPAEVVILLTGREDPPAIMSE